MFSPNAAAAEVFHGLDTKSGLSRSKPADPTPFTESDKFAPPNKPAAFPFDQNPFSNPDLARPLALVNCLFSSMRALDPSRITKTVTYHDNYRVKDPDYHWTGFRLPIDTWTTWRSIDRNQDPVGWKNEDLQRQDDTTVLIREFPGKPILEGVTGNLMLYVIDGSRIPKEHIFDATVKLLDLTFVHKLSDEEALRWGTWRVNLGHIRAQTIDGTPFDQPLRESVFSRDWSPRGFEYV